MFSRALFYPHPILISNIPQIHYTALKRNQYINIHKEQGFCFRTSSWFNRGIYIHKINAKKKRNWWYGRSHDSIIPTFSYYLLLGEPFRIGMVQLDYWNIFYDFHGSPYTWSPSQQKKQQVINL